MTSDEEAVLQALDSGDACWHSVGALVERTGMSRGAVMCALANLRGRDLARKRFEYDWTASWSITRTGVTAMRRYLAGRAL